MICVRGRLLVGAVLMGIAILVIGCNKVEPMPEKKSGEPAVEQAFGPALRIRSEPRRRIGSDMLPVRRLAFGVRVDYSSNLSTVNCPCSRSLFGPLLIVSIRSHATRKSRREAWFEPDPG